MAWDIETQDKMTKLENDVYELTKVLHNKFQVKVVLMKVINKVQNELTELAKEDVYADRTSCKPAEVKPAGPTGTSSVPRNDSSAITKV